MGLETSFGCRLPIRLPVQLSVAQRMIYYE